MKQANVQVAAPGFLGLNSEDSPIQMPEGFASIADNAIIDNAGRISSRKGYRTLTADAAALGTASISTIHEARYSDGSIVRFAVGNNKIFTFNTSGVLTDITGALTITGDDWQIATLNDDTLFFQRGEAPLVYDKSTTTLSLVEDHADPSGLDVPSASCVTTAYGRAWAGGVEGTRSVLYWSDLLIPSEWSTGSSGELNLTNLWPTGSDEITAIAAHNQKLIIFGRESIIVFGSKAADGKLADPANDLFLEDGIVDIGCVGKHAWKVVGSDVWFVDYSGLRSLGRTIQEKSLPIGDLSGNVATQFRGQVRVENNNTRLLYHPDDAFVLVLMPGQPILWCFDTRSKLEDGSARVTTWSNLDFTCMGRAIDGTVWFGNADGICQYRGYVDNAALLGTGGTKFRFRYYMHPQVFGMPSNLKIPKEVRYTIAGGLGQRAVAYWGFEYKYLFKSQTFLLNSETPDFYAIDEYNITDEDDPTEYGSGSTIGDYQIPLSGSGTSLTIGVEVDVLGQQVGIQEINIQTKMGRLA